MSMMLQGIVFLHYHSGAIGADQSKNGSNFRRVCVWGKRALIYYPLIPAIDPAKM